MPSRKDGPSCSGPAGAIAPLCSQPHPKARALLVEPARLSVHLPTHTGARTGVHVYRHTLHTHAHRYTNAHTAHTYTQVHTYSFTHRCAHTCMYTQARTRTHALHMHTHSTHMHTHSFSHTGVHTCMCTQARTHRCTRTHTLIHTGQSFPAAPASARVKFKVGIMGCEVRRDRPCPGVAVPPRLHLGLSTPATTPAGLSPVVGIVLASPSA